MSNIYRWNEKYQIQIKALFDDTANICIKNDEWWNDNAQYGRREKDDEETWDDFYYKLFAGKSQPLEEMASNKEYIKKLEEMMKTIIIDIFNEILKEYNNYNFYYFIIFNNTINIYFNKLLFYFLVSKFNAKIQKKFQAGIIRVLLNISIDENDEKELIVEEDITSRKGVLSGFFE